VEISGELCKSTYADYRRLTTIATLLYKTLTDNTSAQNMSATKVNDADGTEVANW
jgi:hypothetical protein